MAKQKPVFIPGTNMQFASASEAAKALGINPGNIYSVLAGRRKTAGGYKFGYTSNRTIYIPETGRTFSDIKSAAQSVKVSPKKAIKGLEGRTGSAIGGYHFTYADASKISPASSTGTVSETVPERIQKKNRKANKQERIRQRKAKKDERNMRIIGKRLEKDYKKAEKTIKYVEKEIAKYRRERKKAIKQYEKTKAEFVNFLNKVNAQLDVYYERHPNFIHYNPSTPDIFEYMNQIGNKDYTKFDTNLAAFKFTNKSTPDEIKKLVRDMKEMKTALKLATNSHKKSFWKIKVAEQTRTSLTEQFGMYDEGKMDKYADLIWELIDILERANGYEDLGSERIYNIVRDAMRGGVDPLTLSRVMDNLDDWMTRNDPDYADYEELEEILSAFDDEAEKEIEENMANGYNFWDDEEWTI